MASRIAIHIETSRRRFTGPPGIIYQKYSTSNDYPSSDERDMLKKEMQQANAQAGFIAHELSAMRAAIASLEEEQNRVHDVIRQYRAILRPILRLPREILLHIFTHCVAAETLLSFDIPGLPRSLDTTSSLDPGRMPWVLGQVCRTWRDVALANRSLWTFVAFPAPIRFSRQTKDLRERCRAHNHRLGLQLHRSRDAPLTVLSTKYDEVYENREVSPLQILCLSSARWRRLSMELDAEELPEISHIRGLLPELEELDLCLKEHVRVFDLDWFEFAPKLTKLTLSGGYSGEYDEEGWRDRLKLPLVQITDYTWYDQSETMTDAWRHQQDFLRALPRLEKCRLAFHPDTIVEVDPEDDEPLELKRLRELELYTFPLTSIGVHMMLGWFKLPSLTHLTICSSGEGREAPFNFFSAHKNITSLKIYHVEMPHTEFFALLTLLNSLTSLSFGVEGGIQQEYLTLFLPTRTGLVVPALEELVLIQVDDTPSSYSIQTLFNVIQARSNGRLRLVQIENRPATGDIDEEPLIPQPGSMKDVFRKF